MLILVNEQLCLKVLMTAMIGNNLKVGKLMITVETVEKPFSENWLLWKTSFS